MKAVILAAGIGSRLRPITNKKPKTLVEVNGKPILSYILDSVEEAEIEDVILCVGYDSIKIINYCESKYSNLNFTYVENVDYNTTNNMYSLYLAKDFLDDDLVLMNADIVFDSGIIEGLIKQNNSSIAVDKGIYMEESMKIVVEDNFIKGISKTIDYERAYGCSIDMYKIMKEDLSVIKKEMHEIIIVKNDVNQWTEVMLDNLFKENKLIAEPYDIDSMKWFEIDDYDDLIEAELLFNSKIKKLKDKKAFFIDRDGTLTLGDKILDGAKQFIEKLGENNKAFYLITNNSSRTPLEHAEKINSMDLNLSNDNILVSLDSALDYFKLNNIKEIYFVANSSVSDYILNKGFILNDKDPQSLLLTYDDELTYNKLEKIIFLIKKGIPYYATHLDIVCPTINGDIPDIGTFIKIIEMTSDIVPNKTFGKPSEDFILPILDKNKLRKDEICIVGDRLYTDILLAQNLGVTSILVLTGETGRADYEESDIKADIIVSNLKDLIRLL